MSGGLGFEGLCAAIKTQQLASFERESPLGPRRGKSSLVIGPQDFAFIRFFFFKPCQLALLVLLTLISLLKWCLPEFSSIKL